MGSLSAVKWSMVPILVVFALPGCRAKTPEAEPASTPAGSPSTKVLQAVDLTPYEGSTVRKDVDALLQTNAQRNQDLQGLSDPKD